MNNNSLYLFIYFYFIYRLQNFVTYVIVIETIGFPKESYSRISVCLNRYTKELLLLLVFKREFNFSEQELKIQEFEKKFIFK
jgi:hypothetical protein